MLVHSDVAEHSCNICMRSFKKKAYLKTHMGKISLHRTNIEIRLFFCFLVTHTGEKKFRCLFCDRSFADSGNCRKHKLSCHPEELAAHEATYRKKGICNALYIGI